MEKNELTEKINEIRKHADIVDIVSRYVNVIRKGKNHFALCPFHNDSNPSMSISHDKQIYKCFVCNEGGNVFTFIQKYKKIPYLDAVKEVADMVGIDFKYKDKRPTQVINPKIQVLYDIMKDASMYYSNCLAANETAMNYCQKRNISKEIIDEFKIGYSEDFEQVIRFLQARGYSKEDIYRSGIALDANGELKDRFAHRLLFPITDIKGNIVAFSGRIIKKSDMAKYVNSPETDIFIKGSTLYHYASALPEIKKEKKVYICEGFMDVIALCKAGIYNAIALMGTAFTKEHLHLLKFLGVDIVLTMDGDLPGNDNANKFANELEKTNLFVKVVPNYDDVKDVDEFYEKYGKEALCLHLQEKAISAFDFNFIFAQKVLDFNNNEDKKKFLKTMCMKIAKLDSLDRDLYVDKLNKELGFSKSAITTLIKNYESTNLNNVVIATQSKNKKFEKEEDIQVRIITQLMDSKEAAKLYLESMVYLKDDIYRKLANIIAEFYVDKDEQLGNQTQFIANLYTKISAEYENDDLLIEALSTIDSLREKYPPYNSEYFNDLIYTLKEIFPLEERIKAISEEINFTDLTGQKELLNESIRLRMALKEKKKKRKQTI